jgi:hypothetical protein
MNTILRRHMTVGATIGAMVAVAVGCSNADAPHASSATSTARPVSASSQTASPATAKPVDVTVASEGETTVRPGGPPIRFRVTVPYVREGTGMDYITENLVPPFPLSHEQTVTYRLEMAVDAEQDMTVTNGETSIGVTLTDPDDPMEGPRLGGGSYHPVTVETS